ncbi:MAG: electron transfer flavoprotein subunit alpha/FixB family protein [Firmicutes bacterium]|nr:electron transfer flavoprotein subunit alpha/FixB family protein [Bacillota bacterium]
MARQVLVVADLRGQEVRNVTLETLGGARRIAQGGRVSALLIGQGVQAAADVLAQYGAEQIYVVDAPEVAQYNPDAYLAAAVEAIAAAQPQVILLAHSAIGRDLAPLIAARYEAGQASDVIALDVDNGEVVYTRPIYAGKAFTKVKLSGELTVATVRPNNLAMPSASGETANVQSLSVAFPSDLRTVIREVVKKASTGVDLTEAKIIVSGGRGVKSAEGFAPLRELADVLGAALGASRGACDAGYCDYSMQVGQTGKVVTPDLYIACGISGAIQHLAGMSNSKVIVAINKDPEAPIFKVADYGIVGDLFDVVPALTEKLRTVLA